MSTLPTTADIADVTINGQRFKLVPEATFKKLTSESEDEGLVDAVEFACKSIARDLIAARENAGMTQEELSAASGVSVRTISRIESGASRKPMVSKMDKIWDALGVTD